MENHFIEWFIRNLYRNFGQNFRLDTKQEQLKYAEIILDFSYFKISEAQDKRIEESPVRFDQFLLDLAGC